MKNCRDINLKSLLTLIAALLIWTTNCAASDFNLAWDPNCNDYPNLIGYNLYYQEGSSILANPDESIMIYIPLTETSFEPDNPSYQVTGLRDNVRYYFTITAMYDDDESSMSNEISAINGKADSPGSNLNSNNTSAGSSSGGGGCFISALN